MKSDNYISNRTADVSLCSRLVRFNFLFFLGLLSALLILPLKSAFSSSGHADTHSEVSEAETHAAAGASEPIESASAGKQAYQICATCHGSEGEGNAALNSPALAGQEPWYLKRQLQKFKDGIRGSHPDDIYGMQMRPMAMTLADEAAMDAVAEYIAGLPKKAPVATLGGDAAKGKGAYMLCQACHGANAEGNKMMNGPALQHLPDWYIVRQLKNYKAGIRGADPRDIEGMQMAPMSKTVPDEATMKDIAAYINSHAVSE